MKTHDGIKPIGTVRYFQRDNKTGLIIPNTYVEDENYIQNELKYYLAYKIGTDTTDQSLSSRFTTGGTLSSGDDGDDGIAYGVSSSTLSHKLDTDINAGGDQATDYIEFSGTIAGQITMNGGLFLGHDYLHSNTAFNEPYSVYSINVTVDPGRTFYFYWRLTLS